MRFELQGEGLGRGGEHALHGVHLQHKECKGGDNLWTSVQRERLASINGPPAHLRARPHGRVEVLDGGERGVQLGGGAGGRGAVRRVRGPARGVQRPPEQSRDLRLQLIQRRLVRDGGGVYCGDLELGLCRANF